MIRELCPRCDGEAFVRKNELKTHPEEIINDFKICPVCHGCRWVSPWRMVEEELPAASKESADYSDWVVLCNWTPEIKKENFYWEKAYFNFASKKWYDAEDRDTFGTHWQPIEPPEEMEIDAKRL